MSLSVEASDSEIEAGRGPGKPVGDAPVEVDEIRVVEAFTSLREHDNELQGKPAGGTETKENKWKLPVQQLMFMKRMNMQFNDRTKNEIELRQQNISVGSSAFNHSRFMICCY